MVSFMGNSTKDNETGGTTVWITGGKEEIRGILPVSSARVYGAYMQHGKLNTKTTQTEQRRNRGEDYADQKERPCEHLECRTERRFCVGPLGEIKN